MGSGAGWGTSNCFMPLEQYSHVRSYTEGMQVSEGILLRRWTPTAPSFCWVRKPGSAGLAPCCCNPLGSSRDQEVSQSPFKAPGQIQEESQPLL